MCARDGHKNGSRFFVGVWGWGGGRVGYPSLSCRWRVTHGDDGINSGSDSHSYSDSDSDRWLHSVMSACAIKDFGGLKLGGEKVETGP